MADTRTPWSDQLEDDDIMIVGAPAAQRPAPAPVSSAPIAAPIAPHARPASPAPAAKPVEVPPNLPVVGGPVTDVSDDPDLALLQKIADARAKETATSTLPASPVAPTAAAASPVMAPAPATPKTPLETAVEDAIATIGIQSDNEDLLRRLRMLVSLFFRDLRDSLETSSKLTMPVASGGMGFTDAQASHVMRLLNEKNKAFHSDARAKVAEGKEQFVAERTSRVLAASDRQEASDRAGRDRIFSSVTGQQVASPAPAPVPVASPSPRTIPVIAQGKSQTAQPVVATSMPVASARPPSPPTPIPAPPPAPAPVPQPRPAVAPPSPAPQPPVPNKPSMADISVAPRLVGPVEELRGMTLKDFRRLSKEPKEATLKLRDKIDLLGEQTFEKRTEGVQAWQDSAVNKAYLDLLRRSLEGRPVLDLINERQARGEETLSKAEFDSIMEFNRSLRFG